MKTLAIVIALTVSVCSVASGVLPAHVPKIDSPIERSWVKASKGQLCMTHSAQLDPCFEGVFDGVKFKVAYSDQTKRVSYVYTSDARFRTASGLRVGEEISVTDESVRARPGWEVWAPTTEDGWRPIVGFNSLVELKDGTVLKVYRPEAWGDRVPIPRMSSSGVATISGFSRGRLN